MDMYTEDAQDKNGLVDIHKTNGTLKEWQRVLFVSDYVKNIKVGDMVAIDASRYAIRKHEATSLRNGIISDNPVISYRFDIIEINDNPCLLLSDRDIKYVINEYEDIDKC